MPDSSEHTQTLPGPFRVAVAAHLNELGYTVTGWQQAGVDVAAPGKDARYIGLANLYRRATAAGDRDWPKMIREFLSHVTDSLGGQPIPTDLVTALTQLRPRLGQPFSREGKEGKARPWGMPLAGTGLEINMVIDYPNTMAYVTDDMLATTSKPADELLDIALANLRRTTPPDFLTRVSEELDIHVGHCGDGYDAARALLLEDLLPDCPAGFWVVVPSREELAVWPVSYPALGKVHVIKMFAADNFAAHAYPVSDEVFWVWQGTWHPFGIRIGDQTVTIDAPEPFADALRELGDGGTVTE